MVQPAARYGRTVVRTYGGRDARMVGDIRRAPAQPDTGRIPRRNPVTVATVTSGASNCGR